ncbi:MAG: hypothetical protein ACI9U2_002404 [Bradymonadia bacterium]|jgi:hypothetical protein
MIAWLWPIALSAPVILSAPLALPPSASKSVQVDGFFDEWADRPVWTVQPVRGPRLDGPGDLSARIQLAWTPKRLFFAAQVADDKFQFGDGVQGDRLSFTWPGHRLEIVLRDLEGRPPIARLNDRPIKAAKLFGTYRKDGWAVEGSVPLKALPGLVGAPVKLAAVIHDADMKRAEQTVLANVPVDAKLQTDQTTVEFSATAGLDVRYRTEQSDGTPLRRISGNLTGSRALSETVLISDRAIAVLGHGLSGGVGYTFATHGWRAGVKIVEATLIQADGRGPKELWVVHTEWAVPEQTQIEVTEIWGVRDGQLRAMFGHKTGEWMPKRDRSARSKVVRKGSRIFVHPAEVEGYNAGNWRAIDPPDMPFYPLILPWQQKKPVEYRLKKGEWQPR